MIKRGFGGAVNNCIKYMSEGGKDEKLLPNEYLNMIRPYLRDLINKHKPIERLNNNADTNNTDNNNTDNNNILIMIIIIILSVENGKSC